MSNKKLEQTAVTRSLSESPQEVHTSKVRIGPQLHVSVEHAAIAQALSEKEMKLVLCLGRGMSDREIGVRLFINPRQAAAKIGILRNKTRMSRQSLAIMGYALLGQPDYVDVAA